MLDLMFAAALSGVRAAEAAERQQLAPIDYKLVQSTRDEVPERDWRKWVGSGFKSFEDERDCPLFFQKELPGFGTLKLTSACDVKSD